jgi:AMMECR1 domain-containing protein
MRFTMLEPWQSQYLLDTATTSIASRLAGRPTQAPAPDQLPAALGREAASFVTLTIEGRLRGCCGTLEARRALALDVWHNARYEDFRRLLAERGAIPICSRCCYMTCR